MQPSSVLDTIPTATVFRCDVLLVALGFICGGHETVAETMWADQYSHIILILLSLGLRSDSNLRLAAKP